MKSNGIALGLNATELSTDSKLDVILEALVGLAEELETLKEQQTELVEAIRNLSLPGVDFDVDEYDS